MTQQYTLILFDPHTRQPFAEHVYKFDCPDGVSVEEYLKKEFPSYEDFNCVVIDNATGEYANTHARKFNSLQFKYISSHNPIHFKGYPMEGKNIPC